MRSRRQRLAAYALVVRDGHVLLTRLSPSLTAGEQWTLPGGGVEHGEHPHDAVVREVHEETGLDVSVADRPRVYSRHVPRGHRDGSPVDAHSVRLVYEGWVAADAPEPRVVEVDGTTVDAAWHPLAAVLDGRLPVVSLVQEAVADHRPSRAQRVAAYALVVDADRVLLTRFSGLGFHTGLWGLPGGGVEHGEHPRAAVVREVHEETGLEAVVGDLVAVDDLQVRGTAPSGRDEEFHSVGIVYAVTVPPGSRPEVLEQGGTTDAAAWVPLADVASGAVPVVDLVTTALTATRRPG